MMKLILPQNTALGYSVRTHFNNSPLLLLRVALPSRNHSPYPLIHLLLPLLHFPFPRHPLPHPLLLLLHHPHSPLFRLVLSVSDWSTLLTVLDHIAEFRWYYVHERGVEMGSEPGGLAV